MEVIRNTSFFSTNNSTAPYYSLNNLTKKTLLKLNKTHFKPYSIPLFSNTNDPILNPKNPLIISRFGKPKKRRNSLRKKLIGDNGISNNDCDLKETYKGVSDGKVGDLENGSSKPLGESVLWNKLEGWVELYKKDIEFWGIGSNPIFVVFQDSSNNNKVDKVLVDEDEILRRNGVDPLYFRKASELEEFNEVNSKISHARFLAREVESGKDVIPRNSSVAKFVVSGEGSELISRIRSISVPQNIVNRVSTVGIAVVCGVLFIWTMKKLLGLGGKGAEATRFEKELLRRKMKARAEKEKMQRGSVEIVEEVSESPDVIIKRPQLDKDAVLDGIKKAKELSSDLALVDVGGASAEMDFKIKEIQMMAKRAREIERGESSTTEGNDVDNENLVQINDKSLEDLNLEKQSDIALPVMETYAAIERVNGHINENSTEDRAINGISKMNILESQENPRADSKIWNDEASEGVVNVELPKDLNERSTVDKKSQTHDVIHHHDSLNTSDKTERVLSDVSSSKVTPPMKKPLRRMPKIIRSVKEAREYLSQKNVKKAEVGDVSAMTADVSKRLGEYDKAVESSDVEEMLDTGPAVKVGECEAVEETQTDVNMLNKKSQKEIAPLENLDTDKESSADIELSLRRTKDADEMLTHSNLCGKSETVSGEITHDTTPGVKNSRSNLDWLDKVDDGTPNVTDLGEIPDIFPDRISSYDVDNSEGNEESAFISTETNNYEAESKLPSDGVSLDSESSRVTREEELFAAEESWLEKNFHEMEPIVNKMRSGFRDNYMVAREKVKQEVDTTLDFMDLTSMNDDTELDWMKNNELREIVFKVRDNELAGRDPFHLMDVDDKAAFFKGLENEVEKENQKLATLHQWLHSNIENIDYGADGISIYDAPEKVIPRWKGPAMDEVPEFLTNSENQQQEASSLQKGNQSTEQNYTEPSQEAPITKPRPEKKVSKYPKTVIQGSDGSIKPGKKSGKEYWQHTKKWSRGFVESYNAENDPEIKSTMKDIGKDLDRWITEKEIKEAGDMMDRIPEKGKAFIEKKINKLKREMEMFGPQAVVSKYREYADEKEVDYLWWLDLPHVLCIELYTYEGEDQEVGFYTLEMAEDLELEPKPQHLIAFQDPSDCKNFCYIIQAHLEMLGKGKAFIVPQHPKDVFRQAKANGFGVTVIRKGEVQLNVDQPLEEVEELISEIGSKMYHDQIMKERSVDISSLMKGVFGLKKPNKRRRKKRALRRPKKP